MNKNNSESKYNPEIEIEIEASVERVWDILVQLDQYPQWNTALQFASNKAVLGDKVVMSVKLLGLTLKVPVLFEIVKERQELRWCGGISWLMCGHHYFILETIDEKNTKTRLRQGEIFQGVGFPVLWPLIKNQLITIYHDSNLAIKKRAEMTIL